MRSAVPVATLIAFTFAAVAVLGHTAADGGFRWDAQGPRAADAIYDVGGAVLAIKVLIYLSIVVGAVGSLAVLCTFVAFGEARRAMFWALAVGGVLVLVPLLKVTFARPGIGAAQDQYSLPSGNAAASAAIVGAALLLLGRTPSRRIAALGALVVLAEGAGLLLLGWHYPSDILAGWCVAAAWVATVWLVVVARRDRTASRSRVQRGASSPEGSSW